jgi:hypothetical protein
MRFLTLPVKVLVLSVLLLAVATPSRADKIPVRGGSTYGDNAGFDGCKDKIAVFLNTNVADNCEGFTAGVFTIGGNSYNGALFVFLEPGGTAFGTLDIIELSGTSLTLPLLNPASTGPTGVFMCGSFGTPSSVAQDSIPSPMTGLPCTTGASSTDYFSSSQEVLDVQALFSASGVTFINGSSSGLVVFTEDGNIPGATFVPTSTAEPSSLVFLGVGLLALGRKFRRTDSA